MAKQSGLGDAFYLSGYDLSGDVNSVSKVSGGPATLDFTTINKDAYVRQGGLRSGEIDIVSFFDTTSVTPYDPVPSSLPTTDQLMTYARGTSLGSPAACLWAKQLNYDPTRGTDGSLTVQVQGMSNGYGLEWGTQLTAGLRTDTAATAGSYVDGGAATNYGAQAYLHVTAFSGTDCTISVQHCATATGTYTDLMSFPQVTSAPYFARIDVANTTTVDEFVLAATSTTGGFTSVTFSVVFVRNLTAGVSF